MANLGRLKKKKRAEIAAIGGVVGSNPVRYLIRDDFTDTKSAGSVNGTPATPGPGTRTVIDTNSKLSIGSGALNIATGGLAGGDPGLYYAIQTRLLGRLYIASITPGTTNRAGNFGFDNNAIGTPDNGMYFGTTSILYVYPNSLGTPIQVGTYSISTNYKVAVIMRATGMYFFLKSTTDVWKLMFVGMAGTANLYPACSSGSTTDITAVDFIRIPVALYIPPIDTYDTFTRANGAIGTSEATGPDGQGCAAKAWTGATWTIATNKAVNTPTTMADVIVNGAMAADTDWTHGVNWAIAAGVATATAPAGDLSQTVAPLTAKVWYRLTYDVTRTAGTITPTYGTATGVARSANGTYTEVVRANNTGFKLAPDAAYAGTVDNVVVLPNTLSSLFSSLTAATTNVVASVDITFDATSGVQAGLVLALDSASSPDDFIIVYCNRVDNKIYVDKCINGTYTNVTSTAYTYAAGAKLVVAKDGTSLTVWYNNALIGSVSTIADAEVASATIHGLFSTGTPTQAQFANFAIRARGNGGEYSMLDKYAR